MLTEPASVVYRGLTRAAVSPGSRVLVIGDGTIALLAVYLLRLWSPAEVVLLGRREAQRELAAQAGASRFETSPEAAGAGYDLVVEAAGAVQAAAVALTAARRGGTVLLLGLPPHGRDRRAQPSTTSSTTTWRSSAASATPLRPGATWSGC